MAHERGATIDILALIVALFGFSRVFKTAAGMGDMAAQGASHHRVSTQYQGMPVVLGNTTIIANIKKHT